MDIQTLSDLYGRRVDRWPEFAQREGVAALFSEGERGQQWLCDAFDQFTPDQFERMLAALNENHTVERLIALGTILDELFSQGMCLDELQRRIDEHWSGWRRDRQDARSCA